MAMRRRPADARRTKAVVRLDARGGVRALLRCTSTGSLDDGG